MFKLSCDEDYRKHVKFRVESDYGAAAECLTRTLARIRALGDPLREGFVMQLIGQMEYERGNKGEAIKMFGELIRGDGATLIGVVSIAEFLMQKSENSLALYVCEEVLQNTRDGRFSKEPQSYVERLKQLRDQATKRAANFPMTP